MKRVAIIGGGIAGLSAAYYLEKIRNSGSALEWVLFEKSDRLGGVIRTECADGYLLEAGPDSFLSVKPEATDLCRELGLGSDIIRSNDFQRKTCILVKGRLIPIPDGLQFMVPTRIMPMVTTSLFSLGTKMRMARERFIKPVTGEQDESVADFVGRHFGREMVERVAEPLLAGVYGGNVNSLSVRAVLPRFVEMEHQHGSLVRATLKARKAVTGTASQPLFTSLRGGMQQLVDKLVDKLPGSQLRTKQSAVSLQRGDGGWQIATPDTSEDFDAVILAVPAPFAGALLLHAAPQAAALLANIQYTSSAAVLLAYDSPSLPPGFGFLVPASEGKKLLACTFAHNKFSHRAPGGRVLLRCFFSSARYPELLQRREEDLKGFALQELKEILGLDAEPKLARVFRWRYGLPQYETGHLERAAEIEAQLGALPGLHLIGNSLRGIGVPDCIRSAKLAAERIGASAAGRDTSAMIGLRGTKLPFLTNS
ncbi:MAG TPA: protoporphyrinogen oxidase [Candidatus Angelobacter sp.]